MKKFLELKIYDKGLHQKSYYLNTSSIHSIEVHYSRVRIFTTYDTIINTSFDKKEILPTFNGTICEYEDLKLIIEQTI